MKKSIKFNKIMCILLACVLVINISVVSIATENNLENNTQSENILNNETNSAYLEELNKQKEELQEKMDEVNTQLEYVQNEMSALLLEIQKLDDLIREYDRQNFEYSQKIDMLETSINETTQKLNVIIEEYEKKDKQLRDRLVALYEYGSVSYLDVLLSASNLSEFISYYYRMIELTEYDNELIEKVAQQRNIVNNEKTKLEKETAEARALKAKAEQTEVIYKNVKNLQQGYIERLSEEEKKLNEQIAEYKTETLQLEYKIQNLSFANQEFNIQYSGGDMIWPIAVSGSSITSYYGTREHPIAGVIRFHQGLDIGNVGFGAPVVSVMDGVVTYSGWLGSYGNCVMVYHGDGITTLYAHGDNTLVEIGKEVKQGDIVMQTGSTGNSTGPHLHFEVRINGITVNPLSVLASQ